MRQDVFRRVNVRAQEADAYCRARAGEFAAKPAVVFGEMFVALPPLEDTRGRRVRTQIMTDEVGPSGDFAVQAVTRCSPESIRARLAMLSASCAERGA